MRYLFIFIFLGITATGFCQREQHGNSKPWEIFAGYIQPIGKWTNKLDFYNGDARRIYLASFSGKEGMHARNGFNAGVCYTKTFVARSGGARTFQLLISPFIFNLVKYDLESTNGPAFISSDIKPWLQYEAAVAPCLGFKSGRGTFKLLARLALLVKHTAGEVHYERSNVASNAVYIDQVNYSYTGFGVSVGPGVKFTTGQFGIGAELHFDYASGKYHDEERFKNAQGEPALHSTYDVPNTIFKSSLLNIYISYAFGFKR